MGKYIFTDRDNMVGKKARQVYWTELQDAVNNLDDEKVDKISGKELSTNDYTTAEKNKLSGIEVGAEKNKVVSVAGKTGVVSLDKSDVKLGDVDDTSDLNKPISTATQTALDKKVDKTQVLTNVPAGAKFTETTINGKTGAISKEDIVALGIPAQDTNTTYAEITTAEIDAGTASTLRTITGRRVKYMLDKVQGWISGLTKSDVGLENVDNIKQATKEEFNNHVDNATSNGKHIAESGNSETGWFIRFDDGTAIVGTIAVGELGETTIDKTVPLISPFHPNSTNELISVFGGGKLVNASDMTMVTTRPISKFYVAGSATTIKVYAESEDVSATRRLTAHVITMGRWK